MWISPLARSLVGGEDVGFGVIPIFFVVTGHRSPQSFLSFACSLLIHLFTRCMRGRCEAGPAGDRRRGPCAQLTAHCRAWALEQMITKSCAPSLRGTNSGPGEEAAESAGVGRVGKGFAGGAALTLGLWR